MAQNRRLRATPGTSRPHLVALRLGGRDSRRVSESARYIPLVVIGLVAGWIAGCDGDSTAPGATTTTLRALPTTTLPDATTTTTSTTVVTVCSASFFTCRVRVRVTSSEELGSLQFDLDYSATTLQLEGSADRVSCTGLSGVITTFNDDEATSTLRVGMISLTPFAGPAIVADCIGHFGLGCSFVGVVGSHDDIELRLIDASDPAFNTVTPTLELETLACFPGDPPLPFPFSTTTTLP